MSSKQQVQSIELVQCGMCQLHKILIYSDVVCSHTCIICIECIQHQGTRASPQRTRTSQFEATKSFIQDAQKHGLEKNFQKLPDTATRPISANLPEEIAGAIDKVVDKLEIVTHTLMLLEQRMSKIEGHMELLQQHFSKQQ
jgi:hypothetical protein